MQNISRSTRSTVVSRAKIIRLHEHIRFMFFFVPCGKFGSSYLGKTQQPQKQSHPFLSVCAVFSCFKKKEKEKRMVWLPVFGIFNVSTNVDACDCTRGLYGHRKRVCTESWLWEKNPLPHRGLELSSLCGWLFLPNALPSELFTLCVQRLWRRLSPRSLYQTEISNTNQS